MQMLENVIEHTGEELKIEIKTVQDRSSLN